MKLLTTKHGLVAKSEEQVFAGRLTQRDPDLLFQVQAEGTWGWA